MGKKVRRERSAGSGDQVEFGLESSSAIYSDRVTWKKKQCFVFEGDPSHMTLSCILEACPYFHNLFFLDHHRILVKASTINGKKKIKKHQCQCQ